MAKQRTYRFDDFLTECRLLIEGARTNPAVASLVATAGYDAAALAKGKALFDEVVDLHAVQKKEYGEQYQATEALDAAWTQADAAFSKTLKLARVAFRDNGPVMAILGLTGNRTFSLSAWLDRATVFYRNLLSDPSLLATLAKLGPTKEVLLAEQALVQAVADSQVAQRTEAGEAQEATAIRETKVKALDRWIQDFRAVAKVVLDQRPQLLEKLGITA